MHLSTENKEPTHFLQALTQELQSTSPQSPLFTDAKSIQSSIGILFRVASPDPNLRLEDLLSPDTDLGSVEVLLTQRAAYAKDINASSFPLMKITLCSQVGRPTRAKVISPPANDNSLKRSTCVSISSVCI